MIRLAEDTIDKQDIDALCEWLQGMPRLTKGELTWKFEKKFAEYIGRKYAVFVNSGSSANLLALECANIDKNIALPRICWATDYAPLKQLGYTVTLIDCLPDYTVDPVAVIKSGVKSVLAINALGFLPDYELLERFGIQIVEDSCECIGSQRFNKKTGQFGEVSTFSFYYGHHMTTIEGGMICTDDNIAYEKMLRKRSHGWNRDVPGWKPTNFNDNFTFHELGYNLRSTDLQAFLGLRQLDKIDNINLKRFENYELYCKLLNEKEEKYIVSNFAFPIMTDKRKTLIENLEKNEIECRPIIAGDIAKQVMVSEPVEGKSFAEQVHQEGLYVPNHHNLTREDIEKVCQVINQSR